jgi:hypothetical protein
MFVPINTRLGGGLEHVLFFHILGIIIQLSYFSEGFKPPTRRISLGFFAFLDRHMLQSRKDHLPFVRVWEIGANMGDCSFLATGKQWYTVHGFFEDLPNYFRKGYYWLFSTKGRNTSF